MKGKISTTTAKAQPKPVSAKTGAKQMGELMSRKVTKTDAMKEQRNRTAKRV